MLYFIKEPFQVYIHNILIAIIDVFQGLCDRLMEVFTRPEAIALRFEIKFEFGRQLLANCLLKPSVHYCWDSQ